MPFEIKSTPKVTRSFGSFMETYGPELAFVMNERELKRDGSILYVPLVFTRKAVDSVQ